MRLRNALRKTLFESADLSYDYRMLAGGACGYTQLKGSPYGVKIAAGNGVIFQKGQGCGQCYDVSHHYSSVHSICIYPHLFIEARMSSIWVHVWWKLRIYSTRPDGLWIPVVDVQVMCSDSSLCSRKPTRIVITDECPGGTYCSTGEPAFDFSGAAISSMALPGKDQMLRNKGLYDIQYRRVPCTYPKQNIAFKMDAGSNNHWISFTVKYQGGPGDIARVAIRQVQPARNYSC